MDISGLSALMELIGDNRRTHTPDPSDRASLELYAFCQDCKVCGLIYLFFARVILFYFYSCYQQYGKNNRIFF